MFASAAATGGDPPPAAVDAALRKTTEALAGELARPSEAAPDWSEFEWRVARAVAAVHGVSPLLARLLRWQGPHGWREFLETQRAHTLARHGRIADLLRFIDARACTAGVGLVALKGAALHAAQLYEPGERPMADIDLLARQEDATRVTQLLESLGFHPAYSTWKHRVFAPATPAAHGKLGEHAANYLKIELHERICEALPLRLADLTPVVFPRSLAPGLNGYPSRAALLAHLALHAAGSMVVRTVRLLQLNDLARLCAVMDSADWDAFLAQRARDGSRWWSWPPLRLTAAYFPATVPPGVLSALAADAPWLLERAARRWTLTQVSLSSLWVTAFPGISWSHSLAEMLRYGVQRVWPDREMLELRELVTETNVAASGSQWQRLSQGRRVLRWLASPQPRFDTMFAVRAALAQSA